MFYKKFLVAFGLILSLSCMAASQGDDSAKEKQLSSTPSTVSSSAETPKDNSSEEGGKKPDMAEYCREHTC